MPIYMGFFVKANVLDKSLSGDVTAKGYEGWIELQSSQLGNQHRTAGPGSGSASLSEVVVTKLQDAASVAMLRATTEGRERLVVIASMRDDGTAFKALVLRDTVITNYSYVAGDAGKDSSGGSSRDPPLDQFTLSFAGISVNVHDKSPGVTRPPQWS